MGYIHVEVETQQSAKKVHDPCGDVIRWERTHSATTLVVADGIGSGVKANLAATMCASRLLALIEGGASVRAAFNKVVQTMEQVKGTDMPYAVISIVRVLNDGQATVLTYEMPPPLLVTRRNSVVLPQRTTPLHNAFVAEVNCHVAPGEGIVVVSDGITQAGLGITLKRGWRIDGANEFASDRLSHGAPLQGLPSDIHNRARQLWSGVGGDDCSVALASCRWGKVVNIFTGPPRDRSRDAEIIKRFMRVEGTKVVCGGTTAEMVAKQLGTHVEVDHSAHPVLAPPKYMVPGVDLVTEGAVTLNQVYNVLDADPDSFEEDSGVTQLRELLADADRVNFVVGTAENPATRHISFRQRGIMPRRNIVPLLGEKLEEEGKLVVMEYV